MLRYDSAMRPHRVAVIGFDGMAPFELGVVAEVFALRRPELAVDWWYSFTLCAERPGPLRAVGGFTIVAPAGLRALAAADTIVVPGTADVRRDPSELVLAALRRAHRRGVRLVSICSGAFVLAAAGVLDGRRVATHWRYAHLLQERFPKINVDDSVLYIDGDDVLTAAGTAAGIDACLHIIRSDHGAEIAGRVARRMVVAAHRDGGQAQFIERAVHPGGPSADPVGTAIEHARRRIQHPHAVRDLAREAHLSTRQFSRRFKAATGLTPARWLVRERIQLSLPFLEHDPRGIEDIAAVVGFGSPAAYRKHFRALMGISPAAWRQRFAASQQVTTMPTRRRAGSARVNRAGGARPRHPVTSTTRSPLSESGREAQRGRTERRVAQ
jgi:AraC family transcriptional activator FtrA